MIINLYRVIGAGSCKVYKNNILFGELTESDTSKQFLFDIGDNYRFEAFNGKDFSFEKFCTESSCISISGNPMSGVISTAVENIYLYFKYTPNACYINMWRVAGGGGAKVYKNGVIFDELTQKDNSKIGIHFEIGDSYKIDAYGSKNIAGTDWELDKICLDDKCSIKTSNPITGTFEKQRDINTFLYFKPVSDKFIIPDYIKIFLLMIVVFFLLYSR